MSSILVLLKHFYDSWIPIYSIMLSHCFQMKIFLYFRWRTRSRFTQTQRYESFKKMIALKSKRFFVFVLGKNALWWIKDDELLCSRWYSILIDVYQRFQQRELETEREKMLQFFVIALLPWIQYWSILTFRRK